MINLDFNEIKKLVEDFFNASHIEIANFKERKDEIYRGEDVTTISFEVCDWSIAYSIIEDLKRKLAENDIYVLDAEITLEHRNFCINLYLKPFD